MAILGRCCYFLVFLVLILSQASGFVVENSLEEKVVVEENPQEKADKEPDCFICQLLVCFNNKYGGLVAVLMALPKGGGVVVGGLHVNILLI